MNDRPSEYLESKVNTASPAQLHLMLLEGAIRFGRQAEKALMRDDELNAHPPLMRALDIVEELLASVKHSESDINAKMAQLYAFVFRELTSVYVQFDHKRMAEALQVLDYQRETWRLACDKIAEEGVTEGAEAAPEQAADTKTAAPKPHLGSAQAPTGGLSIEA